VTPFFAILAILEALEDCLWPHLPRVFWKIFDFSTREAFTFYALYFLFLSYFVAPVSSVTKWVKTTTKMFAPFQVARLSSGIEMKLGTSSANSGLYLLSMLSPLRS
jgi:hypothetical protein